jgi:hypothetical protein
VPSIVNINSIRDVMTGENIRKIPIGILAIKFLQLCKKYGVLCGKESEPLSSDEKAAVDYIVDEMVGKAPPAGLSTAQREYYLIKSRKPIGESYINGTGLSLAEVKKYAGVA